MVRSRCEHSKRIYRYKSDQNECQYAVLCSLFVAELFLFENVLQLTRKVLEIYNYLYCPLSSAIQVLHDPLNSSILIVPLLWKNYSVAVELIANFCIN